jgi:site-specific DNA-cytosine methylase
VRQVLDIDGFYIVAAEYLECSKCTIVGGPPCQGYSGLNLYRNGERTETEHGQLPKQGEVYLLVGGPPCQGYSGLNLYRNGERTETEQGQLPKQGEVYLLVCGPPCQGYSALNLYRNGEKTETEQGQLQTLEKLSCILLIASTAYTFLSKTTMVLMH